MSYVSVVDSAPPFKGSDSQPSDAELESLLNATRNTQSVQLLETRVGRGFVQKLRNNGALKIRSADLPSALDALEAANAKRQAQWEAVRANQADPYILRTVARADAPWNATSASKAKSTQTHHDGYQVGNVYRGTTIAGVRNMPSVEILDYPVVSEPRSITVSDLPSAICALSATCGKRYVKQLMRAVFNINSKYRAMDPDLGDIDDFSVIYKDASDSWRCHVGGSVETSDPMAAYALALFRRFYDRHLILEPIREGTAFLLYQPKVAHSGERVPGVSGETVLERQLLRFEVED